MASLIDKDSLGVDRSANYVITEPVAAASAAAVDDLPLLALDCEMMQLEGGFMQCGHACLVVCSLKPILAAPPAVTRALRVM